MVCALKKRREIDKLGRESVIGIIVLSVVGSKDQKPQKNKYYRKFRVTLMLHHRVRTQRVSSQRTESKYTERKYTESKYTESKCTERKYTESKCTESKYTESKYTEIGRASCRERVSSPV